MEISSEALYNMTLHPPPIPGFLDTGTSSNITPILGDDGSLVMVRYGSTKYKNKHCTVCDGFGKRCGYTFMRKNKVRKRVWQVVGFVDNQDVHQHSQYICQDCNKQLEKIEKFINFKSDYYDSYWKTYEKQNKVDKSCLVCAELCTSGYTLTKNKNINVRVCRLVGAKAVNPHLYSNYICKRCYRRLENIEKGEQLQVEFASLFWKTRNKPLPSTIRCLTTLSAVENNQLEESPQVLLPPAEEAEQVSSVAKGKEGEDVPIHSESTTQDGVDNVEEQKQNKECPSSFEEDGQKDCGRVYQSAHHSSSLLSKLYEERNIVHGMSDMVLVLGDETFQVHRAVVAAASPYIRSLLIDSASDGIYSSVLLLSDYITITSHTLDMIIGYIYTGSIELHKHNIGDVLMVADRLQMAELKQFCLQHKGDEQPPIQQEIPASQNATPMANDDSWTAKGDSQNRDHDPKDAIEDLEEEYQNESQNSSQTEEIKTTQQWSTSCTPYTCKYCSQTFSSFDQYKRHMRIHEKRYGKHWMKKIEPTQKASESRYHLRTRGKAKKLIDEDYCLNCGDCGKLLTDDNINDHRCRPERKVKQRFRCKTCKLFYKTKTNLMVHLRSFHSNKTSFKCTICGIVFPYQYQLKHHAIKHQTKQIDYECEKCNRKFKDEKSLKSHMQLKKHMRKCHRCEVCRQLFQCKRSLNRHILRHTEDKPYQCTICNEKFFYEHKLEKHKEIHAAVSEPGAEGPIGLVPSPEVCYKCDHCGAGFIQESDLASHLRTAHMIQSMPTSILGGNFFLDDW